MDNSSELAPAVPLGERNELYDNTSKVFPSTPNPETQQPGHIPIEAGAIDSSLREVPQKPYTKGSGKEKDADLRIPYFPNGFVVSAVASGDTREVVDADGVIPKLDDTKPHPEKTALHLELCNPAYAIKSHSGQRRVAPTRGAFAIFAAEEVKKVISSIANFPYKLDQIKVLSIDIRSRGTV